MRALATALARPLTRGARVRYLRASLRDPSRRQPGGHSDRHHLPRRAPRIAHRQRQEAAADDERRRRPERGARPHRRAARRRPRGGPRGQADQRRGRADHREGPGGGRADRRQGPGAGRLPHRRARPDPGGRGRRAARSSPTRIDDADEIRRGADEYAVSVLVGLEGDVVKTLQSIKKGIALLDERRAEIAADGRRRRRRRRTSAGRTRRPSRPAARGDAAGPDGRAARLERRGPAGRRPRRRARPTPSRGVAIDLGEDLRWPQPIDGRVRLVRTNRGILADADLADRARRSSAAAACARSTVPVDVRLAGGVPAVARPGDRPAAADRRRARRRCA